jgi:hypothetical protein
MIAGGTVTTTSSLTSRRNLRSAAFPLAGRLMSTPVQTHPGQYSLGALPLVVAMGDMGAGLSNSDATAFDNARIATVRSFEGIPGVYIARGVTLAPATSDYSSIQNARVMDKACRLTRTALLQYLNSQIEVNGDGTVTERQAQSIEASVNGTLNSQLINTGNAVSAEVVVNRTANVLSTKTLPVSVRVLPFGYAEFITLDIGFRRVS